MKETTLSIIRGLCILITLLFFRTLMLNAQTGVIIHERVTIDSKQKEKQHISSEINTTDPGVYNVIIYAKVHGLNLGGILAVDPSPVGYAEADIGQWEWDDFQLHGGNHDASVQAHWAGVPPTSPENGWTYPIDKVIINPFNRGSGFIPGNYSTECIGKCCLTVHVTTVASMNDILVKIKPEKSTIYPGEAINLVIEGDYPPDLLERYPSFDIAVSDGSLLDEFGWYTWYLENVRQGYPFTYVAPLTKPDNGGGVVLGKIRGNDTLKSKNKSNSNGIMSKLTGDDLNTQSDYVDLWDCPACTVAVLFPELVVEYPTDELLDPKSIDTTPSMPDIAPRAYLKNYTRGTVTYQWNLRVQYHGPVCKKFLDGRSFDDSFQGNTSAENSNVSTWRIDWRKITRGGDMITLDVTATTADGIVYTKSVFQAFKITGLNDKAAFKSALTPEEQVIAYVESKFKQFTDKNNFPVWGTPDGWGIMQLDTPPASDEQVWNWRKNIAEGKTRFAEKKELAKGHVAKVKKLGGRYKYASCFTQQEFLTDAFQLYNGYFYWVWHPGYRLAPMFGGYWEKDPNLEKPKKDGGKGGNNYGGPAMKIYNDVQNGNPPPGWND